MTAKILVVDDEKYLQMLIMEKFRTNIRGRYLEFVFASNGVEALKKLQEEAPIDMVLTDINMPGLDGLSLLAKIKEIDPNIKTVIMSGYSDMKRIRKAMNLGAFDYLTKPLDFKDLEITLKKTLEHVKDVKQKLR
jgi:YesN/AraC family two-component response regulator